MSDKYVDRWRELVSASPEEKRRGLALADAADHFRRAAAALQAAREGEASSFRIGVLNRAIDTVQRLQRELDLLR
jgi:hypothetical protein